MINIPKSKETNEEMRRKALSLLQNKVERQDDNFSKEDDKIIKKRNIEETGNDAASENISQHSDIQIASLPYSNINHLSDNKEIFQDKNENTERKTSELSNNNLVDPHSKKETLSLIDENKNLEKSPINTNEIHAANQIHETSSKNIIDSNSNPNSNFVQPDKNNMIVDKEPISVENPNNNINNTSSNSIQENKKEIDNQPEVSNKLISQEEHKFTQENIPDKFKQVDPEEKKNIVPSEPVANPLKEEAPQPKKITFMSAKKEVDDFSIYIAKVEQDLKNKYGINLTEFNYEEILPDELKLKLVEEFFNSKDIIDLAKNIK